ncbi:hypothetical protein, partial [Salmonella sp. s55962]|uniref:hypothetical protein n=1 Tax=Salmonella sp. s55962 TaxID=3159685 RepID=UPI00397FB723
FEKEVEVSDWLINNGNVSQSDSRNEADLKWLCDEVTLEKQDECFDTSMSVWDEDSGVDSTVSEEKRFCPMDVLYKYHSTLSTTDWLNYSGGDNK